MPAAAVLAYHDRSKHRFDRYAPGPRGLDWANQPDPFRSFAGVEAIKLPLAADGLPTRFNDIVRGDLPAPFAFDVRTVAMLFELSLGLSAWKSYGSTRWALRCNPSSGNLHPTEAYLLCASIPGLADGVYHYLSREHLLERRAVLDDARWTSAFAGNGFLVGVSSIHWREAWKYGMRGWRYCQHDCGHAIGALCYAAAALGWHTCLLDGASNHLVATLVGLDREQDFADAEGEAADCLLWIGNGGALPSLERMREAALEARWFGHANRLSAEHVQWPQIDAIEHATEKPATTDHPAPLHAALPPPASPALDLPFATLARQRRSAVAFDGRTTISAEQFFAMLDALLVREHVPPWSALPWPPSVHVALMVHRVTGLDPGLYLFLREPSILSELRETLRADWLWQKAGPAHLPLFLMLPHDLRATAKAISCHQDIAADGCFALGMLAPVGNAIDAPWRYRHLFWECGVLGHALYLEAEAAGVRATGIGCYFDDEMHRLLGLRGDRWQSLYHFTVGGPREDTRLSTLPPYRFQP